jgi:predicted kinase
VAGVLHLTCGKIAAGKSTLTAGLAEAPMTVLISEDQLLARLYPGEIATLADYARCAGRLREAVAPHIQALLRAGVSVVLDFQMNTLATRAWARTLFEGAGADHVLHYLRLDDETCKARLRARNAAGTHEHAASDAEFDQFTLYFVAPGEAEGFRVVVHDAGAGPGPA